MFQVFLSILQQIVNQIGHSCDLDGLMRQLNQEVYIFRTPLCATWYCD